MSRCRVSFDVFRISSWLLTTACIVAGPIVTAAQGRQDSSGNGFGAPLQGTHVLQPGGLPTGDESDRSLGVGINQATTSDGTPSAGLVINATFDSTITSDPNAAAIETTINNAIAIIQSMFSDSITVNITFKKMTSGLGQSTWWYQNLPYSTFLAALKTDAKTPDDAIAVSRLPSLSTNPVTGSSSINVHLPNLRAIGINANPPTGQTDGTVSVNTQITNPGSPGSSGSYSLLSVVLHEVDEVIGLGSALPSIPSGTIFPEDLFRYSATNTRTFSAADSRTSGVLAFFSIDATTFLAEFDNQNDGGDFGDWQSSPRRAGVPARVQDAFATAGANPTLSAAELVALDVIGYDRAGLVGPQRRAPADYDGDGKSDIVVYRPQQGTWLVLNSGTNFTTYVPYAWGLSTDIPVAGDYDGDGRADITVYRPADGSWWILKSSTNFTASAAYQWGMSTDVPVPGDYDGDGKTDIAVYRTTDGSWWILKSSTNFTGYSVYQWGTSTDVPVAGDYDGDGKTDVAVYRPADGSWWILKSSTNSSAFATYQWGASTDVPVAGDYDGDGRTDVAVYRPNDGMWWVLKSSTNFTAYVSYAWGLSTDVPVAGDYDGDGKTDVVVYRPSNGTWWVLKSSTNFTGYATYQWGASPDIPVMKRP